MNNSRFDKAYKTKLLEVLNAFDKFCSENNLNYYACGGTAIGAVRHKGIIPWDDDIDVVMLRDDYERMISLKSKLNNTSYGLMFVGDPDYICQCGKFYDKNTTLMELKEYPTCIMGVNIDIFPLDSVGNDINQIQLAKNIYDKLYIRYQFTYLHTFRKFRVIISHLLKGRFSNLLDLKLHWYLSKGKREKFISDFLNFDKEWRNIEGNIVFNHGSFYPVKKEMLQKSWFSSYTYVPFEDSQIRLMIGNHEYLTQLFGDYMKLPPVEKQVTHHVRCYINLKEGLSVEEVHARLKKGESLVY